jgi:hypothetical protein
MANLLPPTIRGPLTVLSTRVRVDGPLPGATVDLLVNGSVFQSKTASSTITIFFLDTNRLPARAEVTARWSVGGDTSDPSLCFPEVVRDVPRNLDPLRFVSHVYTCASWLAVDGAFPGAQIRIQRGATIVGQAGAEGDGPQWINITDTTGAIQVDDQLIAVQSLDPPGTVPNSPPAPSVPADPPPFREQTMPTPAVVTPVSECARSFVVTGLIQGGNVRYDESNNPGFNVRCTAPSMRIALVREAHPPTTISNVRQELPRCPASSLSAPPVPVTPRTAIDRPRIHLAQINCPTSRAVPVSGLEPGATLTFELRTATGRETLGRIGVPEDVTSYTFWLPDLSNRIPAQPPMPALIARQELCGHVAESDPVFFNPSVQPLAPHIVEDIVECANWVQLLQAQGSVVRLRSNAPDSPFLSSPTYMVSDWIQAIRPLRRGEVIHAEVLAGCQLPNARTSAPVVVKPLPADLRVTVGTPIRVHHNRVLVKGAITGAQMHVFVNQRWRATATVAPPAVIPGREIVIEVGQLAVEDRVSALQVLCTTMSPRSAEVSVTLGDMRISAQPAQLVRGRQNTVTISAVDVDNGSDVAGTVLFAGAPIGATNAPIPVTVAPDSPGPLVLTVLSSGYRDALVTIPLVDPAPAPQATLSLEMGFDFPGTGHKITNVEWKVDGRTASSSPGRALHTDQMTLPPPQGQSETKLVSCDVDFEWLPSGSNQKESKSTSTMTNGVQ